MFKKIKQKFEHVFNIDRLLRYLRYRLVEPKIRNGATVLDFGCGRDFYFLRSFRDRFGVCYGLDKKADVFANTDIHFIHYDLDVADDIPLPDNSLDQIFMVAVLEHLAEPQKVLASLCRKLKPSGDIILTTPTRPAKFVLEFLAYRLGVIDRREIDDHKHYFSKSELKLALRDAGFDEVSHRYFEFGFNHFAYAKK